MNKRRRFKAKRRRAERRRALYGTATVISITQESWDAFMADGESVRDDGQ